MLPDPLSTIDPAVAEKIPLACDMTAIPAGERPQHEQNARHLMTVARLETRELPDGFAFSFPADAETYRAVTDFIRLERLCCPFFHFTLDVEPASSAIWLRLTGREHIKPFIRAELGI